MIRVIFFYLYKYFSNYFSGFFSLFYHLRIRTFPKSVAVFQRAVMVQYLFATKHIILILVKCLINPAKFDRSFIVRLRWESHCLYRLFISIYVNKM